MSYACLTLASLINSVYVSIDHRFTKGDDPSALTLISPINDKRVFTLYNDNPDGSWDIIIDDRHDPSDPSLDRLASLDAAKRRVARHIAEDIMAAHTLLNKASEHALLPSQKTSA